ncbi:putative linoleate diol synthase [Auriculariales sp. MPI-PUGE-AT-0066]|nr:putative linoleate diol synthase [Auriculariales sp. MPI-PUGE-AT-0066]
MDLVPGPGTPLDTDMVFTSILTSLAFASDRIADRLRPVPKIGAAAQIDDADDDARGGLARALISVRNQWTRGNPVDLDLATVSAVIDALRHKDALDDRKLLLEHALTITSRLPPNSATAKMLSRAVVSMLYFDLTHPPCTFVDRPVLRSSFQRPTQMPPAALTSSADHCASSAVASAHRSEHPRADEEVRALRDANPMGPGVAQLSHVVKEVGTRGQGQGATARGAPLPPPNYTWRLPDGSYNSLTSPEMGRAGSHYTRTVHGRHPVSELNRPDPSLVFDALLRRPKGEFKEHPGGLSGLFFAFAALVIHTVFYTSHTDPTINLTNSYVDLSPLYGFSDEAQDTIRRKYHGEDKYEHTNDTGYGNPAYKNRPLGRGLLHEDSFAEDRFLLLPPASGVILVLFCRNHNYIASKLLEVNERGMWADPLAYPPPPGVDPSETMDKAARAAGVANHISGDRNFDGMTEEQICAALLRQDDEIFNTAKLINVAWFGMAVFSDYFSNILGLVRSGSSWTLLPFDEIRNPDHTFVSRGEGNSCSVEFNHVYHWHAVVSQQDEAWTESVFKSLVPDKPVDQITPTDFITGVRRVKEHGDADMSAWAFGGLKRGKDGRFNDAELARILQNASDQPGAAFGARGTPEVLKVMDVMGILQSRRWGVCTLNEFREYFGLKRYTSFEEWNPDKEIAEAAYHLYGHIDNLELYVGLQAEEVKPLVDGAGSCPGYTISRAILGDAIGLTRGDRFFTTDFTPSNLTPWGFADCARDTENPGFGSMLGPLILRTLPNNFTYNSTYTWFPLMTPKAMKKVLTDLDIIEKYDFSRPTPKPEVVPIEKYDAVQRVLQNEGGEFKTAFAEKAREFVTGKGFFLPFDEEESDKQYQQLVASTLLQDGGIERAAAWYGAKTKEFLKERSYKLIKTSSTRQVDIVRDVLNMVPVHWVATEVGGLSLKTKDHPRGRFLESQLQQMLRDIYASIFMETTQAKKLALDYDAINHVNELLEDIREGMGGISGTAWSFTSLFMAAWGERTGESVLTFLKGLYEKCKSEEEVIHMVFSVVVGCSVEYAQGLVHVINFYLEPQQAEHKKKLSELACNEKSSVNTLFEGYVREALRLDPHMPGPQRDVKVMFEAGDVKAPAGSRVYVNLAEANLNPAVFPDPLVVIPTRPRQAYAFLGDGVHQVLGNEFVHVTMAQVLKSVFALKNLRRAPGLQGTLKRFPTNVYGQTHYEYLDKHQVLVPWANNMVLEYDEE